MSTELVKYEAARHALAVAVSYDEVLAIKNAAEQLALYAKQAHDDELIGKATEIQVRAKRRVGEMLSKTPKNKGARATRSEAATASPATLAEMGITKDDSASYQKLAAIPEAQFEDAIATAKAVNGAVATEFILNLSRPRRSKLEVVNNNEVAPLPPARIASHKEQSLAFYNAVRDLGGLTCSAAELRVALPSFQHFRILENVGPALALLQKVSATWKT